MNPYAPMQCSGWAGWPGFWAGRLVSRADVEPSGLDLGRDAGPFERVGQPVAQLAADPPLGRGGGLDGGAHDRAVGGDLLDAEHLGLADDVVVQGRVLGERGG